mmetsp:Transcript_6/g.10  ORF Transcript_6/g.10 Transcript_6/m.10 type:complete len:331 (-) Transcript_6:1369-2361(-)
MVTLSARSGKSKKNALGTPLLVSIAFFLGIFLGHVHTRLNQLSAMRQLPRELCIGSNLPDRNDTIKSTIRTEKLNHNDGWHSVEVFYGDHKHLSDTLEPQKRWFSQANQDQMINALFRGKKKGYFVDLAANDATFLSNTYSLERELEWNGLCIEPNPVYWSNLTYRDCQVVAAVVGKERKEEINFIFEYGDHGGIVGNQFDNKERPRNEKIRKPKFTVTLLEILERFDAPKTIDYLSLDVEGAEDFIMSSFPFDKFTISVLTVERPNQNLLDLFEKHGYKYFIRLSKWGEQAFIHESAMVELDTISALSFETPGARNKREAKAKKQAANS